MPATTPSCFNILANLFWPSSLAVKACVKDVTAIINAPIPVAIIAPFNVLKDPITPFKEPLKPLNFVIAPPVTVSSVPPSSSVCTATSLVSLPTSCIDSCKSSSFKSNLSRFFLTALKI